MTDFVAGPGQAVIVRAPAREVITTTDPRTVIVRDPVATVVRTAPTERVVVTAPGPQGPPGPAGGGGGGATTVTAASTIQAFHVVAIDPTGLAYMPDRDVLTDATRVLGVANAAALTGETLTVTIDGGLLPTTGTFPTGPLYLGDNGALTATPGGGVFDLEVANAVRTSELLVRPQAPVYLI